MTKNVLLFADATGVLSADDAADASTIAIRDSDGNINATGSTVDTLTASEVINIGNHATVTSVAALDATAIFWPFDGTSGAFAPTLPAVATCTGRIYICKRVSSSGNITLTPNGSETIDGASTYVLSAQWSTVWLFCDGTQWLILAKI